MSTTLICKHDEVNNLISLSWTNNDNNVDHYNIYRRILEKDIKYSLIKEQHVISYDDTDVLLNTDLKSPEISITTQKEYGKIKIFFINNSANIRNYEYYIEACDANKNILSTSNKISCEIANNPNSYMYLIKKADTPLSKHDMFLSTQDFYVILNNIDNGKYVIYAYAKLNDVKSSNSSKRFVIDNTIFVTDERTDVPNCIRYNNRYRGPQESRKKDFSTVMIKNNLSKLKKRVEYLDKYKEGLLEKPQTINVQITNLMESIESSLSDIRKELKYERRNN